MDAVVKNILKLPYFIWLITAILFGFVYMIVSIIQSTLKAYIEFENALKEYMSDYRFPTKKLYKIKREEYKLD